MRRIIREYDPEPIEFVLGLVAVWWGFVLAFPADTWGDRPAHELMHAVFRREWIAGTLWMAQGALQVALVRLRRFGNYEGYTVGTSVNMAERGARWKLDVSQ